MGCSVSRPQGGARDAPVRSPAEPPTVPYGGAPGDELLSLPGPNH